MCKSTRSVQDTLEGLEVVSSLGFGKGAPVNRVLVSLDNEALSDIVRFGITYHSLLILTFLLWHLLLYLCWAFTKAMALSSWRATPVSMAF